MAEQCKNCGAELFTGQQFCRKCGTPVRKTSSEDLPTQILPHQQGNASVNTNPLPGGATDPVFPPRPTAYQPPVTPQPAPLSRPARSNSLRNWIIVLVVITLLGSASVIMMLASKSSRLGRLERELTAKRKPHPQPQFPPPGAMRGADGSMLSEEGAESSRGKTVITKTYSLSRNAAFSIKNVNGDITVEGWDQPQAEVRIIKRGGSEQDRQAVQVIYSNDKDHLSLSTSPAISRDIEVTYEVKLPRDLRQIEIASTNSDLKVSNIKGVLAVDIQRGSIELVDVSGVAKTNIIKGRTKVTYQNAPPEGAQEFKNVHGSVEVEIESDINADLKAETMDGEIKPDNELGLKVEKQVIGQHVVGRLGSGGKPIVIKVVNGDIKLNK